MDEYAREEMNSSGAMGEFQRWCLFPRGGRRGGGLQGRSEWRGASNGGLEVEDEDGDLFVKSEKFRGLSKN